MSKKQKYSNFIEDICDINLGCSDLEILELSEDSACNFEEHFSMFDSISEISSMEIEAEGDNVCNIDAKKILPESEQNFLDYVCEGSAEIAADGTYWYEIPKGHLLGRHSSYNIFREIAGPTAYANQSIVKGKPQTAFFLIMDIYILEHIRRYTEEEGCRVLGTKWNLEQSKFIAFIGLLYARGAYQAKNLSIKLLWNSKWGPPCFSNTMSKKSFSEIMRFLRFDDKNHRKKHLESDKFALISEVWNRFIKNSQNCYVPGELITVDEQLFPTKARCNFTQYIPNKPDKFGIKFWLASDVKTKYTINGFPYLGIDENREASTKLGEFVVLKLLEPFTGSGRCVTTDNFFTSTSLVAKLIEKKITIVGTIRSNKKELPK